MATVTLKGTTVNTNGELPAAGSDAKDFLLTNTELSDVRLSDYNGKKLILNIFPSVDTSTCAASIRAFNQKAASLENTVVLCISKDLPFAHARFCSAEGIKNVESLSILRNDEFGKDYGVRLVDGPFEGLMARSVVIIDEIGKIKYTQLVPEIADEPNYDDVLNNL
jgi:thiol peroxidase